MPSFKYEFTAYRDRDHDQEFLIYEADEQTAITLVAGDDVRFKIWLVADSVVLDLNKDANDNGSVVLIDDLGPPATVTVKIMRADMVKLRKSRYKTELLVVDSGDGNRLKPCGRGDMNIEGSAGGNPT